MNHMSTKNIALTGIIAGLIASIVYLLAPLPRGMVVLAQLGAILILGACLGHYFRKKLANPYAVIIYSMLIGYGMTRVLPFINAYLPISTALFITLGTVGAFFLWSKYFALKINSVIKYSGAVFFIIIWWIIIPLTVLYFLRAASMPQ